MKSYVELEEITLMEKETTNLRDRLLIRLLFHSGCRISEALGLKVEDIDLAHSTVTIQHLKSRLKLSCTECKQRLGRSHTFCPKCGCKVEKAQAEQQEHRRQRVLPVDSDTLSMGSPAIDPDFGATQTDIHRHYKQALLHAYAEDTVAIEEEARIRKGLPPLTIEEADERTQYYFGRIPQRLTSARYASFTRYFSHLKRLGFVEETDSPLLNHRS